MTEPTSTSILAGDFHEWIKELPNSMLKKVSIHELVQVWKLMKERDAKVISIAMDLARNQARDHLIEDIVKYIEEKEGEWIEHEGLFDDDIADNPTMNVLGEIRRKVKVLNRKKSE